MRLPIQCALSYPERMPMPPGPPLELAAIGSLNFARPDVDRFPCLRLAIESGRQGATFPAAMAAADEVAVHRFMAGELGFLDIPAVVEQVLEHHEPTPSPGLDAILAADAQARRIASNIAPGVPA
jgi:1-deoxy-D-xylulose-5-phosphate reductoisomerase